MVQKIEVPTFYMIFPFNHIYMKPEAYVENFKICGKISGSLSSLYDFDELITNFWVGTTDATN